MLNLTDEVKKVTLELGAAAVGTAPADHYVQAPQGHRPADFLPAPEV